MTHLAFVLIGSGAVLWDRLVGLVPSRPGLSILDPGLWPWWIALLFALMAVGAVLNAGVFRRKDWTVGPATANAALNLAIALPALWLHSQDRLINQSFWPTLVEDGGSEVARVMAAITAVGIATIAIWGAIDGFLKARCVR